VPCHGAEEAALSATVVVARLGAVATREAAAPVATATPAGDAAAAVPAEDADPLPNTFRAVPFVRAAIPMAEPAAALVSDTAFVWCAAARSPPM
jgi:hypothetical protein